MPWLLNEDSALLTKLTGLTVQGSAVASPITVHVRFLTPQDEFSDFTYPLIGLTQASVNRAPERESRGLINVEALPEGIDPSGGPYFAETPIPHNIDYQVQLFTRLQQHCTELVATLSGFDYLPERFGYLEVPQDNTVRRLDLLGGPELGSGRDSDNKRLFTATWRIRVSTELFTLGMPVTYPEVQQVDVTVDNNAPGPPG